MIPFYAEYTRITDVISVSGDYKIKDNYGILEVDASSGAVTITMPDLKVNRAYTISKRDNSGNAVTIDFGSNTCNGSSTLVLSSQYDTPRVYGGTSEWILG